MVDDNKTNQKIEAQAFNAPGSPQTENKKSTAVLTESHSHAHIEPSYVGRWWHSQFNLMIAVFSLLAIAALLFVSLSPDPLAKSNVTLVDQDGSTSQSDVAAVPSGETEEQAPWDEKRRAQARADSQDILSGLLQTKKVLEAQGVKQWAEEEYSAALETADSGDQLYKQQDYQSAIGAYKSAAEQLDLLKTKLPEILKQKVDAGFVAINEGKSGLAKELFQEALTLDKNSIPALNGLGRAESLDQVLELYAQGKELEQKFKVTDDLNNLDLATSKYEQALKLDKDYVLAQDAINNVASQAADKRYRQSMSKGFNSLFSRKYSSAKSAFAKALKIKPNDVTAKEAYTQSLASNRSASLTSLLSSAKKHESNEEWGSALSGYQAVLQRDSNQVSAKLGQIRSKARSDLDDRLVFSLSDPLSLSKASVREKANLALSDAKGIQRKGPRLTQQISQLEAALGDLNQTIKITLSSDAQTSISLVKAGSKRIDLGKFTTKNLALKPGRYVVKGVRLGFQDVRTEIDILPGTTNVQSYSIRCTEAVNGTAKISQGRG